MGKTVFLCIKFIGFGRSSIMDKRYFGIYEILVYVTVNYLTLNML
jgi:hypothetical protein